MIKINLLAQKKRAERSDASQVWLAVVMVIVLAEVAMLFLYHSVKAEELTQQQRKNAELTSQIEQAKKNVANHEQVKADLALLRAREEAIQKLQSARSGPTAILMELARILTPGRGPSVDPDRLAQLRRDNPLSVFNPNWDARRLWITAYVEAQRSLRIEGKARDGEDVSELARRLNLSSYFYDVKLLPAQREADFVKFSIETKVRY
ncbi:MAG TPA: PilN domain-containing protein [Polyangiaceae bacterium]|nr:PilN domain-containing protein [Polyangiaceae bacterium]